MAVQVNRTHVANASLKAGQTIASSDPKTLADELLTSLSERAFTEIRRHVSEHVA